jgi:predicted secreted protein
VVDHDELLDADAAAADRRDLRRIVIITTISLALVVLASLLLVASAIHV